MAAPTASIAEPDADLTLGSEASVVVASAVEALTSHYSQPIHAAAAAASEEEDESTTTTVPHFDALLGGPPRVAEFVRRLIDDRILASLPSASDPGGEGGAAVFDVVAAAAGCYPTLVRPAAFPDASSPRRGSSAASSSAELRPSGAIVLAQYEIFLALLSKRRIDGASTDDDDVGEGDSTSPSSSAREEAAAAAAVAAASKAISSVVDAVRALSSDVTALSASPSLRRRRRSGTPASADGGNDDADGDPRDDDEREEGRRRMIRNLALPKLLRILSHCVGALRRLRPPSSSSSSSAGGAADSERRLDALAIAAAAALPFAPPSDCLSADDEPPPASPSSRSSSSSSASKLTPLQIAPSLSESLSLHGAIRRSDCPPLDDRLREWRQTDADADFGAFLSDPVVDLEGEDCSLNAVWIDPISGIGSRAGSALLRSVAGVVAPQDGGSSSRKKETTTLASTTKPVLETICDGVGAERMASIVRAHFFGRDAAAASSSSVTASALASSPDRSGPALDVRRRHRETESSTIPELEPRNRNPSRIFVAIRFVSSLRFPNVNHDVLEQVLPVLYALIDSSYSYQRCLGGAGLIRILDQCSPTTFVSSYLDAACDVLDAACRSSDGAAWAVLSLARAEVFRVAAGVPRAGPRRRSATRDLLSQLRRRSFSGADESGSIAGVVAGGIGSLLEQHASLPNADGIELFRHGLEALLPLLRWDYGPGGRKVQAAALAALVSSMLSAHPVAPRHGGKVAAEVLRCVGRADRDRKVRDEDDDDDTGGGGRNEGRTAVEEDSGSCRAVAELGTHVLAVALVLCGERAASVLDEVEGEGKNGGRLYDPVLAKRCREARRTAEALLEREEEAR